MSLPSDIPHNIHVQPIPVEKVAQIPKAEPGKTEIDHSALESKDQKTAKEKRIEADEQRKKRNKKRDSFERQNSNSEEPKDRYSSMDKNESDNANGGNKFLQFSDKGSKLDIVG